MSSLRGSGWIAEVNRCPAARVAEAFGLYAGRIDAGPCPVCKSETRHTKRSDRRGAIGFAEGAAHWRCHQCDAAGDSLKLAMLIVCEGKEIGRGDPRWPRVKEACARAGLLSGQAEGNTNAPRPAAPAPAAPKYPPIEALRALWEAAPLVTDDAAVAEFLRGRSLNPEAIRDANLARVLICPMWGCRPELGYRLICPMFDATGTMRSFRARLVGSPPWEKAPKSVAPTGFGIGRLVYANLRGIDMLASHPALPPPARSDLVEGEMDFFSMATRPNAEAVFGYAAGAWSAEFAARIPPKTRIVIWPHADDAGREYLEEIRETLPGRAIEQGKFKTKGG